MGAGQNCGNYDGKKGVGLQQLNFNELKHMRKDPDYLVIQTALIYM